MLEASPTLFQPETPLAEYKNTEVPVHRGHSREATVQASAKMSDPNNPNIKQRTTPQWGLMQREMFWAPNDGKQYNHRLLSTANNSLQVYFSHSIPIPIKSKQRRKQS